MILLSLVFGWTAAAQTVPPGWSSAPVPGVKRAWISNKNSSEMLTLTEERSTHPMSFDGASDIDIASGITLMRAATLNQFGFTHWTLRTFKHIKQKGIDTVEMSGSYIRPDRITVQFVERQRFRGRDYTQVSYLLESDQAPTDTTHIHNLLLSVEPPSSRSPASELSDSKTEGAAECEECAAERISAMFKSSNEIQAAAQVGSCEEQKGFFIDPSTKSVLQKYGLDYNGKDPSIIMGRSTLTCFYGAGAGVVNSLHDLVMAAPDLAGLAWRAGSNLKDKIASVDYKALAAHLSPANLWSDAKHAYTVTTNTIGKAFSNTSNTIYEGYRQGGVAGSVNAVAQAAYQASPHAAIAKYLADTASALADAVKKEWGAFKCLKPEVATQALCDMIGYVGLDIATGKVVLSAIQKDERFLKALRAVQAKLESQPVIGRWMMRNLKKTEESVCKRVAEASWMVDAKLTAQGEKVAVATVNGKIYARGIDPTNKTMGCFQVVGKVADAVNERIRATEAISEDIKPTSAEAVSQGIKGAPTKSVSMIGSGPTDIFTANNPHIARTATDYVEATNGKAGIKISQSSATTIASNLSTDSIRKQKYGDLLRSVSNMADKAETASEQKTARTVLAKARETMENVNEVLAEGGASRLNISLVSQALHDAEMTGNGEGLVQLNRTLYELNRALKRSSGDVDKALELWESELVKSRPQISANAIARAKNCLFSAAK